MEVWSVVMKVGLFVLRIFLKNNEIGKWNTSFSDVVKRENKIREMMDKWKCDLITDTSNAGSTTVFISAFGHFKVLFFYFKC